MIIRLGLLDYGMGNLHSVEKAFLRLDQIVKIIKQPYQINGCNALILPGVGAFDPAMKNLENTGLIPYIKEWVEQGKPLLGICLGLQLLFESSDEGNQKGLGILKGHVKKLPTHPEERIPHMGWSKLTKIKDCPLFTKQEKDYWMYFVHSYFALVSNQNDLAATVDFGDLNITALVWEKHIGACQFHPEKSGKSGEKMLLNWIEWIKENSGNKIE